MEVLATLKGEPVLVRQGSVVASTFHPELTDDKRVHELAFASLIAGSRHLSLVRSERRDGTALLTLDRPGANAFSPDLVSDLSDALSDASDAGAVVLASSNPRIFSAGWDLTVIVRFGRVEMAAFVQAYCDLIRQMFVFERPLIAALSGHAIAGGLIVAAAADERVLAEGKGELGLSEVLLGVPVPQCALEIFRYLIGPRATERLAATGENVGGTRALEIGLVDRLAPAESVTDVAIERARLLAGAAGGGLCGEQEARPGRWRSPGSTRRAGPTRSWTTGSSKSLSAAFARSSRS